MEGTPEKIVVEIDLAQLWVGGENGSTFAEHVASLAVGRLVKGDLAAEATADYRRRAIKIADEEIREALRPVIAQALDEAIQRTDGFGQPRGEKKTLREIIVRQAVDELQKPRERQGAGYGRTETLVQQLIRTEVEGVLATDLRQAVHEGREQILAKVRDQAGEIIAETIERLAAGRRL